MRISLCFHFFSLHFKIYCFRIQFIALRLCRKERLFYCFLFLLLLFSDLIAVLFSQSYYNLLPKQFYVCTFCCMDESTVGQNFEDLYFNSILSFLIEIEISNYYWNSLKFNYAGKYCRLLLAQLRFSRAA